MTSTICALTRSPAFRDLTPIEPVGNGTKPGLIWENGLSGVLTESFSCIPQTCTKHGGSRPLGGQEISSADYVDLSSTVCPAPSKHPRIQPVEPETLQKLFVSSRHKFVRLANSILRNRNDAEDAVQNAFISAHRNLRAFEGRSAFNTWFTRIVLNAALMIRRKRDSSCIQALESLPAEEGRPWIEQIPVSELGPELACARREQLERLEQALMRLKHNERQAILLAYHYELSTTEASGALGIKPGTYKSRLMKAKRRLFKQLSRGLIQARAKCK